MGKRGPAPTPTKVLQLRGTYRSDRHAAVGEELQFDALAKLPPAPRSFDALTRYEWERVGPLLIGQQLLTEADLAAFAMYCMNVATAVRCSKILKRKGFTCSSPNGFELARPEVAIRRQAMAEARKFMQEFGLTPSARTRISATAPQPATPDNPFAEFSAAGSGA